MHFYDALKGLLAVPGQTIHRTGWNGKGMYLFLDGIAGTIDPRVEGFHSFQPFIVMRTADGKYVPWLCSQTDMLADDWWVGPGPAS